MKQNFKLTDEYIIKNKSLRVGDYVYIVIAFAGVYYIIKSDIDLPKQSETKFRIFFSHMFSICFFKSSILFFCKTTNIL